MTNNYKDSEEKTQIMTKQRIGKLTSDFENIRARQKQRKSI